MDDYRIVLNGGRDGYSIVLGDPPRTYRCEVRIRDGSEMLAIFVDGIDGSFRTITEAVEAIRAERAFQIEMPSSNDSPKENPNG
jgi:hypothetical protein